MIDKLTAHLKMFLESKIEEAVTADKPLGIIKTVYDWEPYSLSEANLPALTIEIADSAYDKNNTKYEAVWRLKIAVKIAQKTTYWSPKADREADKIKLYNETVAIKKIVQRILEGWDPNGCGIDSLSLFGIFKGMNCFVDNEWCILANEVFVSTSQYNNYTGQGSVIAYEGVMEVVFHNAQIMR